MDKRRIATIIICALAGMLIAGCATIPTSLPKEKAIDVPELGGAVKLVDLQYGYKRFQVESGNLYDPADRKQLIAILTIKPKNLDKRTSYDFRGIVLKNGDSVKYPVILRHYYEFNDKETEYGYKIAKDGALDVTFSKKGEHRILLAYLYEEGELFDSAEFYGKLVVEFDANLVKGAAKFD